jgi:hypothetical protein
MKKFIYSIAAFATTVFGLTACSSEEDVPSQGTANDTYFELTIGFPQEVYARSTENEFGDNSYDQGIEREYKVEQVSLYFFDSETNKFVAQKDVSTYYTGTGFTQTTDDNSYKLGVGYTTGAVLIQKSENLLQDHVYHVYALANMADSNKPAVSTETTEAQFTATTMNASAEFDATNKNLMTLVHSDKALMPMSSRGYYQNNDKTDAKSCTYVNFKYSANNNKANPVKMVMYLERSYGRITLEAGNYTDEPFAFPLLAADGDFDLKTNKGVLGRAVIEGYKVINKTLVYNTFRQVGSSAGVVYATNPFGELADRNYAQGATNDHDYLMTPTFTTFSATYSAATGNSNLMNSYNEGTANLAGWNKIVTSANSTTNYITDDNARKYAILDYPAENAMERSHQVKGYTTGILLKVRIEPNLTGYEKGKDIYGYDNALYLKLSDIPGLNLDDVKNANNYRNYGVTKYPKGYCYYIYYVRHLDNGNYPNRSKVDANADLMGDMEFAVVRSNSYDLAITGFFLTTHTNPYPGGKPVPDYDPENPNPGDGGGEEPDPDDPDNPYDPDDPGFDPSEDTEAEMNYMNVNIVIRPWIVRGQQVIPID